MNSAEFLRIHEAYINMAKEGRYRPQAPGDGLGSTYLTPEELDDPDLLEKEASEYAARFIADENAMNFNIGISNYRTNRALVYVIEAAKNLCAAHDTLALRLLRMAVAEVEANPSPEMPPL